MWNPRLLRRIVSCDWIPAPWHDVRHPRVSVLRLKCLPLRRLHRADSNQQWMTVVDVLSLSAREFLGRHVHLVGDPGK